MSCCSPHLLLLVVRVPCTAVPHHTEENRISGLKRVWARWECPQLSLGRASWTLSLTTQCLCCFISGAGPGEPFGGLYGPWHPCAVLHVGSAFPRMKGPQLSSAYQKMGIPCLSQRLFHLLLPSSVWAPAESPGLCPPPQGAKPDPSVNCPFLPRPEFILTSISEQLGPQRPFKVWWSAAFGTQVCYNRYNLSHKL